MYRNVIKTAMFSWIKNHLIPHHGNDHRPHLLRGDTARGIVLLVLFLEIFVFFSSIAVFKGSGFLAAVLPAVLDNLTNLEREKSSLPDLVHDPLLDQAAQMKANDMATKSYFAHTSPEGLTPWHWLDAVGYNYEYAGENLAINFTDSKDVTEAWMNSPTHRANIQKAAYTAVGTGVATGTYQGYETIFVAQVYAKPAQPIQTTAAPVSVTETPTSEPETIAPESIPAETPTILGSETPVSVPHVEKSPTLWQKLASSPRHTMNYVLYALATLVGLAILIKLIVRMHTHHIDLVANGMLVLVILFGIYLANGFLSSRHAGITPAATFEAFDATAHTP